MKEPVNAFRVTEVNGVVMHLKDIPSQLTPCEARSLAYWLIRSAGAFWEDSDGMTEALRELLDAMTTTEGGEHVSRNV